MSDRVRIEIEAEGLAVVRLNRPEAHNGMDWPMLDAVLDAQKTLRARRDLRAVILCGEGPSFCAGLDVKTVFGQKRETLLRFLALWSPRRNAFQRWSLGWRELPVPVIAAIHGHCYGAGIQLALGADLRVARPDARLSVMEAKWGLVPDMGGAVLIRELMPIDRAKDLLFSARVLDGNAALAAGLVSELAEDPLARARALAAEYRQRSPDAIAHGKFLLQAGWTASEGRLLAAERARQRDLIGSANQKIAVARNAGKERPFDPLRVRR
ncbi:MAG TPA: crotonase/enoyl-CoA hydratase family protein [Nevskiaceae bacterium]|nr:crotonase/enoyl-CoA hydratase family protein [Nevskiaceae bacterium]